MRCSHRAAHPLRRETLSALWADSAPERRTERALPGARARARSRGRVAPVCGPRGPPRRNARRGCPHPPRCAGLLRGSLRPSLPRLWRGPPPLFAHCAPAPLRGARRCARRLWPGAWRGPPAPPGARGPPAGWPPGPVCVPSGSLFGRPPPLRPSRWFARSAAPCAPLSGAPGAARGLPSRACSPAPLHPAGARAACGPRLWGALRPRRGYGRFLLGLCLCACRCACRWVVPHGGPPWAGRAALAGGEMVYRRCRGWGARTGAGKSAQRKLAARLGAGSVRYQLRFCQRFSPFYWTFTIDFLRKLCYDFCRKLVMSPMTHRCFCFFFGVRGFYHPLKMFYG